MKKEGGYAAGCLLDGAGAAALCAREPPEERGEPADLVGVEVL